MQLSLCVTNRICHNAVGYDEDEIGSEDGEGWEDDMEDSAEGAGSGDPNGRLANRRHGKGTGNPGKPGKKLRLADLQSQFGVGLKVKNRQHVQPLTARLSHKYPQPVEHMLNSIVHISVCCKYPLLAMRTLPSYVQSFLAACTIRCCAFQLSQVLAWHMLMHDLHASAFVGFRLT